MNGVDYLMGWLGWGLNSQPNSFGN